MKIHVEGWEFLPHIDAVTTQFLLLELLKRPELAVSYQGIPYNNSQWKSAPHLLPAEFLTQLQALPQQPEFPDLTLRIHPPDRCFPQDQATVLWATTPWGTLLNAEIASALAGTGITSFHQMPHSPQTTWVTPSHWSKQGLLRSGIPSEQIAIAPLGVHPQLFKPLAPEERQTLRRQLGWEDYFIFLNVGGFEDRDGIRPLLKAFAQVVEQHPNSRLVLKGCDALYSSQGCLLEASQAILRDGESARVQPRMAYLGKNFSVEQMAQLYQGADAYVSPYLASGFNLPVLEAMACGLPVICTAGGPTDDFTQPEFTLPIRSKFSIKTIDHQVRFFLHPDWEHLVMLMQTVINQPDFCQQARQIAPQVVAENYTWKHSVDRLLTQFNSRSSSDLGFNPTSGSSSQASTSPDPVNLSSFDLRSVELNPVKNYSLIVEGWRAIPHSYALINCCQLLEFIQRPQVQLFHRDIPYVTEDWKASQGLFSPEAEARLERIYHPEPNQIADVTLRMYCPFNLANSTSTKTVVFGCTEWGIVPQSILRGMKVSSFHQAHSESDTILLTASHWSRQGFLNSGADPERVVVVPLGINPEIYHPVGSDHRQHLRQKLGWQDGFVFLNIGVMWNERQGVDRLLKAFAAIAERHPQTRLVLKGRDAIFPSQASIQKASQNILTEAELERVHARLHYIGHNLSTQDMAELYWAADAYVSPYSAEGFNLPVLEAIACGVPVICTAGGPTDDFTRPEFTWKIESQLKHFTEKNGDTKFYLDPNQDHLTELMAKIIEEESCRQQMTQIGPKFVQDQFTWAKIVDQLLPILFGERN
ncbi:MAG: glycosyltransferase [Microcoleaceae cyanobacterium]